MPRPITTKTAPKSSASQKSCEARYQFSASWLICGISLLPIDDEPMRVSLRRPRASDWAGRRPAPASGRLQIEQDGDQERQQAQQLRRGEADEQAALLAVGCRRIAQRAFQQADRKSTRLNSSH